MSFFLLFFFFFFFFFFLVSESVSLEICEESCALTGPEIRFPFGLQTGNNSSRCSFPGFNLACNNNFETILTLPLAGDFIVRFISYQTQEIHVRDPENCLPRRFLSNFSLVHSPFNREFNRAFSFLNCSSDFTLASLPIASRQVECLSNENFTIFALPATYGVPLPPIPACKVVKRMVDVPVRWSRSDMYTTLVWSVPDCVDCEERGGTCGFRYNTGSDIGCYDLSSNKSGLPRSAKYGIIVGVGIPALLCIIGLGCYLCGRIRTYNRSRHSTTTTQRPIAFLHPQLSMTTSGLDGSTIELYPKILLGESRRLPNPNDNTCPICLCEYEAKETLRTIPECNHYFHANCIDEWLKMNSTCPLCRNSPDISSMGTPASSIISTSSSSLSSRS